MHDRLDIELINLIAGANEAAIDVTDVMFFVNRDDRLQCISSTKMREISSNEEAIALLEAIREELKWVRDECDRLKRFTHCSERFLEGGRRTSFAYWPTPRVHEQGVARAEAREVTFGELRTVMQTGISRMGG